MEYAIGPPKNVKRSTFGDVVVPSRDDCRQSWSTRIINTKLRRLSFRSLAVKCTGYLNLPANSKLPTTIRPTVASVLQGHGIRQKRKAFAAGTAQFSYRMWYKPKYWIVSSIFLVLLCIVFLSKILVCGCWIYNYPYDKALRDHAWTSLLAIH